MALVVTFSEWPGDLDLAPLESVVAALNAASELSVPTGNMNVRLVDDEGIRALNKQYSGADYATDVLSFSYIENGATAVDSELGDIAISLEMATRQAEAAQTGISTELALLLLHGCLHILGYDHQDARAQQLLDRLQSQIMAAANLTYRDFQWK